jgi:hypothetical protein
MPSKTPSIPPLFKADAATLSFYGSKTGATSVSYQGWDASKVVALSFFVTNSFVTTQLA